MSLDTSRFSFIHQALTGTGVFRPLVTYNSEGKPLEVPGSRASTALVRYPRESDEKFARRNDVAWYENHLLSACSRFIGYLAKKPPSRDLKNPLCEQVANDCNWRGDSIDVFLGDFLLQAKARGSMLLLVDMPRVIPDDEATQMEARAFPYFVPIYPESVVCYDLDQRGRMEKVEINVCIDGKQVIKGWDSQKWWIREGETTIDQADHNLGACPVLTFTESGDFPYFGDFAQIADISKRLFNARSELDEILRAQTFSLLTYHVPPETAGAFNAGTVAEAIGTNNMLIHTGDQPGFIAPPNGPADTYLAVIKSLEESIKRVGLVVEAPDKQHAGPESGVALTIRFQALNSALTKFARRAEDFERRAWELVCKWLGIQPTAVSVEWSKDYALADLKTELETLGAMQAQGFPEVAVREQMKLIAGLIFSAADPQDFQAIIDAIEGAGAEILNATAGDITAQVGQPPAPMGDQPPQGQQDAHAMDLSPLIAIITQSFERLAQIIAEIKPPVVNVKVDGPAINVTVPESAAPALPTPAPIVINQGSGAKIIDIQTDANGTPIGATVRSGSGA